MIFKYPYTDLYNLNLDWVIQAIKEVQQTITDLGTVVNTFNGESGDVTLDAAGIASIVGGIVNSFNGRSGAVELTEADVNATLIDIVWTSDPGEVIGDLTQTALNELFAAGRRVLIFNNALGEPDRIYFLTRVNDVPTPQQYIPTGAIAGVASVNGQTGAVTVRGDTIPVSGTDPTTVEDALAAKEDVLTFDSTPTSGSSNPVTSAGIEAADGAIRTSLATLSGTVSGINNRLEAAEQAITYAEQDITDLGPYNGLDSDSTTAALAAAQGKALSQQKADLPVVVTVTVDGNGPSMSAADQAKLTSDMIMCWWYNPDKATKLNSSLNMIPGDGSISWGTNAATASSSTTFTIAFIHSANGGGIASVIKHDSPTAVNITTIEDCFIVRNSLMVYPNGLVFGSCTLRCDKSLLQPNVWKHVATISPAPTTRIELAIFNGQNGDYAGFAEINTLGELTIYTKVSATTIAPGFSVIYYTQQ